MFIILICYNSLNLIILTYVKFLEVFLVFKGVINAVHIIFSLSIIIIVLLQSGKQVGLSGAISGGAETFFGKNKGRTLDALLSKYTAVAAIGFLITSVVLQIKIME